MSKSRSAGYLRRANGAVDIGPFATAEFNAIEYLKSSLPIDSDDAIHSLHRSLLAAHERTVAELGRGFYRNYPEYVSVTKEAVRFEQDLAAMQAMMAQLKGFSENIVGSRAVKISNDVNEEAERSLLTSQNSTPHLATASPAASPEFTVSEPVDEGTRTKLKKIAEILPEASSFLSSVHRIVQESSALAIYTDKQWKPAQGWIFDSGILIASRKAKVTITQGVRQRLTFERTCPAAELSVSDVKDTADLQNCIKLKCQGTTIFLHSEDAKVKATFLQALGTIVADAKTRAIAKTVSGGSPKKTVDPSSPVKRNHLRTGSLATIGAVSKRSFDVSTPELSPEKAAQLQTILDELDETIDRLRYDEAVEHVDRIKHDLSLVTFASPKVSQLRLDLSAKTSRLISAIFYELTDLLINRECLAAHIQRLLVLGFAEDARERFLINRSELIRLKCQRITFSGNVATSVGALAAIVFESIDVAFDWYNASFRDPAMIATLVSWAKNEVTHFAQVFSRQVFRRDTDPSTSLTCIIAAFKACGKLKQCGLDLAPFLSECLGSMLRESLNSVASDEWFPAFESAFKADNFDCIVPLDRPDLPANLFPPSTHVTESFVCLAKILAELQLSLGCLGACRLGSYVSGAMIDFIEDCAEKYLHAFYGSERSNTQLLNLASNYDAISSVLLPRLNAAGSVSAEVSSTTERLNTAAEALYLVFAENAARACVPKDFNVYSAYPSGPSDPQLSQWLLTALPVIVRISRDCQTSRRSLVMDTLLSCLLSTIKTALDHGLVKFNPTGGLAQFSLDLKFLAKTLQQSVLPETLQSLRCLVDRATSLVSSSDLDQPLPTDAQLANDIARLQSSLAKFTFDM